MSQIATISDESLKHWGLLSAPFTPEFFFQSLSFKTLAHWLSDTAAPTPRLYLVRSEIGSGISTAFEQIANFGGIAERAIDPELTRWTNQPVSEIVDGITNRFGRDDWGPRQSAITKIWLIHAFRPSQVTSLRNRLARLSNPLADLTIVVRIEDNPSTRSTLDELPTFTFVRTDKAELARCVARSIRSAGATRTIFQEPAINQLVRHSKGSFNGLATATHHLLTWGHSHGLSEITPQAVWECFGAEIRGIRHTYRRAA